MRTLALALLLVTACSSSNADSDKPKRAMDEYSTQQQDVARSTVKSIAFEAYPQWSVAHPGKQCPDSINDLGGYMNPGTKLTDPWGGQYQFLCGSMLPSGAKGVLAVSAGPDGKLGTDDDVKSSDK